MSIEATKNKEGRWLLQLAQRACLYVCVLIMNKIFFSNCVTFFFSIQFLYKRWYFFNSFLSILTIPQIKIKNCTYCYVLCRSKVHLYEPKWERALISQRIQIWTMFYEIKSSYNCRLLLNGLLKLGCVVGDYVYQKRAGGKPLAITDSRRPQP